jgi:hypothetical protein
LLSKSKDNWTSLRPTAAAAATSSFQTCFFHFVLLTYLINMFIIFKICMFTLGLMQNYRDLKTIFCYVYMRTGHPFFNLRYRYNYIETTPNRDYIFQSIFFLIKWIVWLGRVEQQSLISSEFNFNAALPPSLLY